MIVTSNEPVLSPKAPLTSLIPRYSFPSPVIVSLSGSVFQIGKTFSLGCYANSGQFASIHS